MKPFIGVDRTVNRNNEVFNGEEFVTARASAVHTQMYEKASERVSDQEKKTRYPLAIRIIRVLCGFYGLVSVGGFLKADVPFAQAYENAAWLLWSGAIALVIWGVLTILKKRREKTVLTSEETDLAIHNAVQTLENVYSSLGVPSDAVDMDILMFPYVIKDGQYKAKNCGMTSHVALDMKAFRLEDQLCLADAECRYSFPISQLQGIETVKKSITIPMWNKDEAYDSPLYKPYKLSTDNYGFVHIKGYHILKMEHKGELWGIYFPCYELPAMETLTGLKAE